MFRPRRPEVDPNVVAQAFPPEKGITAGITVLLSVRFLAFDQTFVDLLNTEIYRQQRM